MRDTDPSGLQNGYAICTTMRSGSTWLAELLGSTGVLGNPSEYFSGELQRRFGRADYPDDVRAQIDHVLKHGRTPNGVYGFKIYPLQLDGLAQQVNWTAAFPDLRFIHFRRRDLLGQAISRWRVRQTLQWRSTLSNDVTPHYDGGAILEAMRRTVVQDARWHLFFARNAIEPLRLVYEDALLAPQATVDAVGGCLGLETRPMAAAERIEIAVQRDETTDEWRRRFLEEYADLDVMDAL